MSEPARLSLCQCCGRALAPGEGGVWYETRTARRLSVRARRLTDGLERPSANGLYLEKTVLRALLTCPACHQALVSGATLNAVESRRFRRQAIAVLVVLVATILGSPWAGLVGLILHRGLLEAPPAAVLMDRTFKPYLDRDPTLPRSAAQRASTRGLDNE